MTRVCSGMRLPHELVVPPPEWPKWEASAGRISNKETRRYSRLGAVVVCVSTWRHMDALGWHVFLGRWCSIGPTGGYWETLWATPDLVPTLKERDAIAKRMRERAPAYLAEAKL